MRLMSGGCRGMWEHRIGKKGERDERERESVDREKGCVREDESTLSVWQGKQARASAEEEQRHQPIASHQVKSLEHTHTHVFLAGRRQRRIREKIRRQPDGKGLYQRPHHCVRVIEASCCAA